MKTETQKIENAVRDENDLLNFSFIKISAFNLLIGFTINLIWNPGFLNSWSKVLEVIFISLLSGSVIWKGSMAINSYLRRKYSWFDYPVKRSIYTLVCLFFLSFTAVSLSMLVDKLIFHGSASVALNELLVIALYCIFFPILFGLVLYSYIFFRNWKASVLREEILKREQLGLQYETLKTQANPQLLFNSLNALKFLVKKDATEAANYVRKLSEVYRYSLDLRNKEAADLKNEIKNLKNYIDLVKSQNPNFSEIHIDIPENCNAYILPLSLQMTIESILEANPGLIAFVGITLKKNRMILLMTIAFKSAYSYEYALLEKIRERYIFLTKEPLIVEKLEKALHIYFPLVQLENEEHGIQ